ncbi:ester cyclase [Streptomyces pseudovenezuelae]|uniref:Ketosteroid isomerase-like protein n=1 Tax=Streptomyces pseudovenezuelae TaxID=67350 RepID=A0ABT6LXU2_9ACTN|nr:ester cyclase [Streptomyces pseudovenezuelae]MDH6221135.1 ketosteroid isomerase-like protein [Streptomyces pseudovenezuelae]
MGSNATDSAHSLFRVIETGDPALAADVVHADFHNREAVNSPAACAIPGPAGVLASSAWMRSAFTDLRFPVLDTGVDDERGQVFVRVRMQGRHTGPFVLFRDGTLERVMPPTGRELDYEQIHVLTVRDGKVIRHEAVRDDMTMLGQLGTFPPTPALIARLAGWKLTGRDRRAAAAVSTRAAEAAQYAEGTGTAR